MPSYVAAYLESSPRDPLAAEESSRKAASRVNEAAPRKVGCCGSLSNYISFHLHVHLRVLALTRGDGFCFLKHSYSREYTINVILCQLL